MVNLRLTLEFAVLSWVIETAAGFGASYDELRSGAVKSCQAIDRAEYQTGLLFNPDGYRSYYVRSGFPKVAIQFRHEAFATL